MIKKLGIRWILSTGATKTWGEISEFACGKGGVGSCPNPWRNFRHEKNFLQSNEKMIFFWRKFIFYHFILLFLRYSIAIKYEIWPKFKEKYSKFFLDIFYSIQIAVIDDRFVALVSVGSWPPIP